jgi:dual specificity phosphatase 12
MQTRGLAPLAAAKAVRARRACTHPNYGFLRQLHAFAACGYAPSAQPELVTLRSRARRDVRVFLAALGDVVPLDGARVHVASELPADAEMRQALLWELEATHVVCVGTEEEDVMDGVEGVEVVRVDVLSPEKLRRAAAWARDAVARKGQVLVFSEAEAKACAVAAAYRASFLATS